MGRETDSTPEATAASDTMGALAFAIDALREELGLTLADLADRAGTDAEELWLTVNGYVPLTSTVAAALLSALADYVTATPNESGVRVA